MQTMNFDEYLNSVRQCPLTNAEVLQTLATRKHAEACKEIYLRNRQWVCWIVAREWADSAGEYGVELMDLVMAGERGLWQATCNFDPRKGRNYYLYVKRSIQSYIQNEFYKYTPFSRRQGKQRRKDGQTKNPVVSLDEIIYDDGDDTPITRQDLLCSPENLMESILQKLDIERVVYWLKEANREVHPLAAEITQYRYAMGFWAENPPLSLEGVARKLNNGYSKEGIRKIERRTLAYLKTKLNGEEMSK